MHQKVIYYLGYNIEHREHPVLTLLGNIMALGHMWRVSPAIEGKVKVELF